MHELYVEEAIIYIVLCVNNEKELFGEDIYTVHTHTHLYIVLLTSKLASMRAASLNAGLKPDLLPQKTQIRLKVDLLWESFAEDSVIS